MDVDQLLKPQENLVGESDKKKSGVRGAVSREAVPREAVPREAVSREAVPREAVPREAVPGIPDNRITAPMCRTTGMTVALRRLLIQNNILNSAPGSLFTTSTVAPIAVAS